MSRKKMEIDWEVVDEMLTAQCSGAEVAYSIGFKCSDTLYKRVEQKFKVPFSVYMQQKRTSGQALLRSTQFKMATKDKDRVMNVWLGKQYLGQKDKIEAEVLLPGLIADLQLHLNIQGGIVVPESEEILNSKETTEQDEIATEVTLQLNNIASSGNNESNSTSS